MDLSFEDQRRMIHHREHTYKDYIDVKYFVLTLKNNQFFNYILNKYNVLIADLVIHNVFFIDNLNEKN